MKQLEEYISDGSGLYKGQAGWCLAYFIHGQQTRQMASFGRAKKIFQSIVNEVHLFENYTFNNGLLGFGWLVEYLTQMNFLKLDTDRFLEDLDDQVYKIIVYNQNSTFNLEEGLLGQMLYLYKRLNAVQPRQRFYRKICNIEVLSIAIDKLAEEIMKIKDSEDLLEKNLEQEAKALILLCKLLPLKINKEAVESMIVHITDIFDKWFTIRTDQQTMPPNYKEAIAAWYYAGEKFNCSAWTNKVSQVYGSLPIAHREGNTSVNHQEKETVFRLLQVIDGGNKFNWKEAWLQ